MPPPQATYVARTSNSGYDPATLSDDEDDSASVSSSAWSALAANNTDSAIPTLAVLDGKIPPTSTNELDDWKVSRVGGEPSFPLSSPPPIDSRTCLTCSAPMPLVIQLYCPLPHSSLERVVYVFACPRPACQKRREPRSAGEGPGCVRAWRANGVWRDGEEALRREEEEKRKRDDEDRVKRERKDAASKIQLGGLVFGGAPSPIAVAGGGGAAFNPFATATPAAGGAFNPFAPAGPSTSAAAVNPFAPVAAAAPVTPPAANPFAPASMTAALDASAIGADQTKSAAPVAAAAEQIISTWPPIASSSTASPPVAAYAPQYVATLYEPASSKGDTKGKSREAELARAFEAELAIRSDSGISPTATASASKPSGRGTAVDDFEDDFDERRPGKGSGGRVKKGAERAAASKKPSSAQPGGGGGGVGEGYEIQRVKGVDDVFLRFQERVSREGRQIVRYDYNAQPLPYSSASTAYKLLHPPASANSDVGTFRPSQVPPCRYCRGPSAFELQLMPHLALGLDDQYAWATVWVFSCAGECTGGASGDSVEEGEAWREERVLVEWEDEGM
ncbi:hypothetical protein BMF94_3662 [Rhodotorula taiwanensis]|uniref:Programmed cell death protein 2 C-terminal domain-containing protein n=1 Tax=Rhodotorula taiwanensis TaxID=741276 RepID=A0A2S5B987_9BASI|nr:hypothetical protein BMF94_3662 [Rhodotorula taiwanensis]